MYAENLNLWLVRLGDLLGQLRPRLAVATTANAVLEAMQRQDFDDTRAFAHDVQPPQAVMLAIDD